MYPLYHQEQQRLFNNTTFSTTYDLVLLKQKGGYYLIDTKNKLHILHKSNYIKPFFNDYPGILEYKEDLHSSKFGLLSHDGINVTPQGGVNY